MHVISLTTWPCTFYFTSRLSGSDAVQYEMKYDYSTPTHKTWNFGCIWPYLDTAFLILNFNWAYHNKDWYIELALDSMGIYLLPGWYNF